LIGDISRLMRRAFRERLEGSSLTLAQARTLVHVARNEGIRQVHLADLLEIRPITLARLIDQLAGDGLVERRHDPADRRAYRLFLRPQATPHLAAIRQVSTAIEVDALRDIDEHQAACAVEALRKMRDKLAALQVR
jgi:DNA-binding MarR family transcriptional regulator